MLKKQQLQAQITSGIIILDKNSKNKIFLEILEDYSGICLRSFQRMQRNLEYAFLAKLFENTVEFSGM